MKKSKIIQAIGNYVLQVNKTLELDIPQAEKSIICSDLEYLLHSVDMYEGFQYLYWEKYGYERWRKDGSPEGPEKTKYIYGTDVNDPKICGEFSRRYYVRMIPYQKERYE